jgi:hypothetical protein
MNYFLFSLLTFLLPLKAFAREGRFSDSDINSSFMVAAYLSVLFGVISFSIFKFNNKNTKFTLSQTIIHIIGFSILSLFVFPIILVSGYLE